MVQEYAYRSDRNGRTVRPKFAPLDSALRLRYTGKVNLGSCSPYSSIYNVTLCRKLIFEDAIEADSEEKSMEIAMKRNSYDELNWYKNGPTQVVCMEPRIKVSA